MADRHTYMQTVFSAHAQSSWNTGQTAHHLSYQGGPKSHIFFVLTNLDCFDFGTSLKSYVFSRGSDVAYIGHWPRAMNLFIDNQTVSLTDRQTGRQAYIFCCA